jgi:hypothetical protein
MTHDYKYENLREEDRNALIPAFKRKLVVRIDGEPFVPASAETLTRLQDEDWQDWRERDRTAALDDAELEREYRERYE